MKILNDDLKSQVEHLENQKENGQKSTKNSRIFLKTT